jgi:uncharacterized membrane protein
MEFGLMLLGLAGLVAVIGGFVGFFSLFSSGNKDGRIRAVENETAKINLEITKLSVRLEALRKTLETQPQSTAPPAQAAALATNTPKADISLAENFPDTVQLISDDELTQQAIATAATAANTMPAAAVAKPIAPSVTSSRPPFKPAEPNFIERGIGAAKGWLFGGNTMVRAGIVVLFIGISFLLKLAVDKNMIPIELRLMAVALGGIALLVVGWRLRDKRAQYSWALQGGGIGVLYLTIFAAMKLYQLIPAGPAFALLAAVAFLSAFIAVKQSALPLAFLGFAGGFLAPILTSTGQGNHVGLFSYYLVLNLAIAYVAFHKSWRPLNVLGWGFTFIIGTLWGVKKYVPENFATTEPFLIIFFLLFTAIAVLYAHRQATKASDYVDATLVFGTPLVGFSLQYGLLHDSKFGLAYSALALGVFYLGLAWWVLTRKRETLKFLGECFLALGIGFATLTIPLALDGRWTSAAWAVEGVGLLWVGLKQNRTFPALAGLALQLLAAIAFANGWGLSGYSQIGNQNMFLGVAFIALSGWACGALLNKYRAGQFGAITVILALWGWVWWVASGLTAINQFLVKDVFMHAGLAFVVVTSLLLPYLGRQFNWPRLGALASLLLPAMIIAMLWDGAMIAFDNKHPFANYGYLAWPLAFAAYAWTIARDAVPNRAWLRAPLLWLVAIIGGMEWQYQLNHFVAESNVWKEIGWAIVPMLIMAAVMRWQADNNNADSKRTWLWIGCLPLAVFLVGWYMLMSLHSSGNAAPLPYIPLLNPLDITLAGVLLLLLLWQRAVGGFFNTLNSVKPILAAIMGFALLNGMLLRTLHHWAGTPFEWTSIFSNSTVQMAFTILWALTAFVLMLLAHKRGQRQIWIVGAGLMGLVVAKLFLLDLAQHGSVERIVSFIGAGVMLLVMGYFAPLPPAKTNAKEGLAA